MFTFILTMVLLMSLSSTVFACDEQQSDTYVTQIIFGDKALSKANDENVKMLMSALFLCSEQADNRGQDKIDYLKAKKVSGVPELSELNIKQNALLECSHNSWEHEFVTAKKNQANRRKVLQNTVNKVFDFGFVNNIIGGNSGKCNSFAAVLYYSHILADYLADDPSDTEVNINGRLTSAYSGQTYVEINNNRPSFTPTQKNGSASSTDYSYSSLDGFGRTGVAFGCIGPEKLQSSDSKVSTGNIKPSGWNQNKYKEIIGANNDPGYIFERCHLIAHQFGGKEDKTNLITGTKYLNKTGMIEWENRVREHIDQTGCHVLYRVTPIYKGNNMVASGVQMEAYSVEDKGVLSFNVFCYNVQPGISINYANGNNEESYITLGTENILPFARKGASDDTPDLIFEMNKHFEILFKDQKPDGLYNEMMNRINSLAIDARSKSGADDYKSYLAMKEYEYTYFNEILKIYVPQLLMKEPFFYQCFNNKLK